MGLAATFGFHLFAAAFVQAFLFFIQLIDEQANDKHHPELREADAAKEGEPEEGPVQGAGG